MRLDSDSVVERAVFPHVQVVVKVGLKAHGRIALAVDEQVDAVEAEVLEVERVIFDVPIVR